MLKILIPKPISCPMSIVIAYENFNRIQGTGRENNEYLTRHTEHHFMRMMVDKFNI